jgi:hypothetical protein
MDTWFFAMLFEHMASPVAQSVWGCAREPSEVLLVWQSNRIAVQLQMMMMKAEAN